MPRTRVSLPIALCYAALAAIAFCCQSHGKRKLRRFHQWMPAHRGFYGLYFSLTLSALSSVGFMGMCDSVKGV